MSSTLPAASQPDPGWLITYTSLEAERCWIEPATGPVTVYVVSKDGEGISGARFRLVPDSGLNWQYVGETIPDFGLWVGSFTGNANDGIILEGGWGSQAVVLLAVAYFATAVPEPCARLRIDAYPGSVAGTAEVRLSGQWTVPTFVYDLAAQPCSAAWCVLGTAVESSTWGAIKALYR